MIDDTDGVAPNHEHHLPPFADYRYVSSAMWSTAVAIRAFFRSFV